jgi:hypothetical protein
LSTDPLLFWQSLESLVRRDPARRGVASFAVGGIPLCAGHLQKAAEDLANRAATVAIVTGFCIVDAKPPVAETDGPPGALFLARDLRVLGIDVALVTDRYARPALEVGCEFLGIPRTAIHEIPLEDAKATSVGTPRADRWVDEFLNSDFGRRLTHLIAIERVGPSHTEQSLQAQHRTAAAPLGEFEHEVPLSSRDMSHNMRGVPIDAWTARAHRLFEIAAKRKLPVTTIGIGDGGNEIGMGAIPWEILRSAITVGPSALVPCRIATNFTILAGVSDWGAYALALAVLHLRGLTAELTGSNAEQLRELIERLVRDAGLVDGVTGRREASVDGLPLETYLQVFAGILDHCRLETREQVPPSELGG